MMLAVWVPPPRTPLSRSAFFTNSLSVRAVLAFVIQNRPHHAGANPVRKPVCRLACHSPILPGARASDKPEAVQSQDRGPALRMPANDGIIKPTRAVIRWMSDL